MNSKLQSVIHCITHCLLVVIVVIILNNFILLLFLSSDVHIPWSSGLVVIVSPSICSDWTIGRGYSTWSKTITYWSMWHSFIAARDVTAEERVYCIHLYRKIHSLIYSSEPYVVELLLRLHEIRGGEQLTVIYSDIIWNASFFVASPSVIVLLKSSVVESKEILVWQEQ